MKPFLKTTLFLTGILSLSLPSTNAAVAEANASTPAPAQHRVGGHALRRLAVRRQVARRLGLSNDQTAQLKSVRQNTAAAVKAIRADSSLTPEQRKAKVRETLLAARTQARSVLTPEQQKHLHHLRARAAHRGGARRR